MSKNYFKKTLAGIFAVALVASSMPLAPFAPMLDSISITASAASVNVDSWLSLQVAIDEAEDGIDTTITLAKNITAANGDIFIAISAGKVITLDLNGYTLDRGLSEQESVYQGRVIYVDGGSLTIKDSSTTQSGTITGGNTSSGGGIYNAKGNVTIESGNITENTAANGGGIYNFDGNVTIKGGNITANTSGGVGGGISNTGESGTLTITGGNITGNIASHGGGVEISGGVVTITDGNITENTVSSNGGGVDISGGVVTITGGNITGNTCGSYGGGIFSNGTLKFSDGIISGNTAKSRGGGIYNDKGTITIEGGTITENTSDYGGGIYNFGTLSIIDGIISKNTAKSYGGGIFAGEKEILTVGGSAVIADNKTTGGSDSIDESNIHSQNNKADIRISTDTPLTKNAEIGITVYLSSGWDENTDISTYIDGMTAENAKQICATNCGSANRGTVYYITAEDSKFVTTKEKPAASNKILDSELTWEIDENGVLTIKGDDEAFPECWVNATVVEWCDKKDDVKEVVFDTPKLKKLGNNAVYGFKNLTSVKLPDTLISIGDSAFMHCTSLTSVTIPDSVTSIDNMAFAVCTSLTSVTIPDSVTRINNSAFAGCTSLTSVTIPDSVTSIDNSAFNSCASLTSVTIPASVTSIGHGAFALCSSLTSVTIPDSVTSIGNNVFSGCASLTSVTIPDAVTSIGECVFMECSSLTSITIPDSVKSIGWQAFSGCSSLTSITFAGNMPEISSNAFSQVGTDTAPVSLYYPKGNTSWKEFLAANAENIDTNGVLNWKGGYFNVKTIPTTEAKGYSVSYDGDVTINFHYLVTDDHKNGYVKFSDGTKVKVSASPDKNGYYVFPISMPAKNMYDKITAQFYDEKNNAVGDAVTFDLVTYMDEVKEYDPNYSDFVDSFLEYGKQAAAYFGVTGAPAGKTYSDSDFASISNTLEANYASTDNMGDTFVGATLLLKSTPKLRLYYSEDPGNYSTNEKNPDLFYTEKEISPVKFGTEDLNGYYVYNYIYKAMNSDDNGLKALCAALYNMSKAIPAVG